MRLSVVLPMAIPSRSSNNSLRWVWLAPEYLVRAKWTTSYATGPGSRIGCSATTVAVGNCGSSLLPVGRQDAPGVPSADTHQRGSLVQRHVLCQQAVENL